MRRQHDAAVVWSEGKGEPNPFPIEGYSWHPSRMTPSNVTLIESVLSVCLCVRQSVCLSYWHHRCCLPVSVLVCWFVCTAHPKKELTPHSEPSYHVNLFDSHTPLLMCIPSTAKPLTPTEAVPAVWGVG